MGYFIDPQGNYPRHAGDIQITHPGWDEETDALPNGWVNVEPGETPEVPDGFVLVELKPAQVDGVYVRQFDVVAAPTE